MNKIYYLVLLGLLFSNFNISTIPVSADSDVIIRLQAGDDLKFNQTEITVPLGVKVTVIVEAKGAFHTFTLDDDSIKNDDGNLVNLQIKQNNVANVSFTAPTEEREVRFYCVPHQASGMEGIIKFTDNTKEAPVSIFPLFIGLLSLMIIKNKFN